MRRVGYSNGALTHDYEKLSYHINMPEAPSDTVQYYGWVSDDMVLTNVRVMMVVINTKGSYTLRLINDAQSVDLLQGTNFNMNTLSPLTVTEVPIVVTESDRTFADKDMWHFEVYSSQADFDGSGIYVELVFEVS